MGGAPSVLVGVWAVGFPNPASYDNTIRRRGEVPLVKILSADFVMTSTLDSRT